MQIMLAPVKLYSELIIKVSFPSCPPSHTLNTAVRGAGFLRLDKTKKRKGGVWRQSSKESREGRLPGVGALCPVLMDVFALWWGERESPKLATALPCEKDKRTPSCQLKFKHSFTTNFMGREGGSGRAAVLMPGQKAVSVLPFVPHRPA